MVEGEPEPSAGTGWWLFTFGLAYSVLHHQGFVLARLGTVGESGTRWADWIDMATPYVVLAPAAVALAKTRPSVGAREWALFAVGSLAYTQGHGIHLAANSVSNLATDEGLTNPVLLDVVHLWDELMGHYLWYGGISIVVVVLGAALRRHRPSTADPSRTAAVLIATATGATYATNALEGHFAWPALGFVAVMSVLSIRDRRLVADAGRLNRGRGAADLGIVGFVTALLLLGFYGAWHRGFPDPSSVGWNLLAR